MESFSIYINIFSRSQSFLSYVEKKLWGPKNPENGLFQKSQPVKKDNSYSCLVFKFQESKLKLGIEVVKLSIWPQKCLFLKRL